MPGYARHGDGLVQESHLLPRGIGGIIAQNNEIVKSFEQKTPFGEPFARISIGGII